MRNRKTLIILCACSLLIGGCGDNKKAENESTGQPDAVQSSQAQPENTANNDAASVTPTPGETAASAEMTAKPDGGTSDNSSNASGITVQKALDIALKHAQVKESDITSKRIKKDFDDGREVYDVEFYVGNREYDYEISVSDGSILKSDYETDDDFNNRQDSKDGKEIKIDEAKKIALDKVPGAKKIQIKKDVDDGKTVYEGEIYHNNIEYEFEIDALTGKIIKWEEDND